MKPGKKTLGILTVIVILAVYTACFGLGKDIKGAGDMRFGIDIRGGVEAVFEPVGLDRNPAPNEIEAARNIIETRLDDKNITDREVTTDNEKGYVIVRFPWKSDEKDFKPEAAIAELGDMAKAFSQVPEVTVIIDHLGNVPGLDEESCAALAALAELPNSYIKVSGDNPVDPDIVKYVRDTFGPKKVLYSSNWPVVELNSTFATHFQLMLDTFGEDEDFFENNARRAYNID